MFGEAKSNPEFVDVSEGGGVMTIRLCHEASKNALSVDMVNALVHAFGLAAEPSVKVVVLCGGDSVFCSGASFEILSELIDNQIAPSELGLGRVVLECPVPVISACQGWAVGGGFTLALSADMVVLSEERRYGFNFMDLGITPGMGTTVLAAHFLGEPLAQELMFTGELRRGSQFGSTPINHVVPALDVEEQALQMAWRIAEKPRRNLELLKANQIRNRLIAFNDAIARETAMHEETLSNLDLSNFGGRRV